MLNKLKQLAKTLKRELTLYQHILKDERTPKLAKIFLGLAVGYVLLPFDLIPDFIPVLGQLDDLIIVPGLFFLALRLIPKQLLQEHRQTLQNK
ncbi:MAG: YkvA family protein [Trueperaceae bacterium]